jgi:uncharacterized membrane protein YqgA involved in biofilm formation
VIGTIVNATAILAGGLFGLARKRGLSRGQEAWLKILIGSSMVYYGLRLAWDSIGGSFGRCLWQLSIVVLSMMLGKATGHLLKLQRGSNRIGEFARQQFASLQTGQRPPFSAGLNTSSALFCAAPLGLFGAVADGLGNYPAPLVLKGLMESIAAVGFAQMFGWSVPLAALPVLALQGTITLLTSAFLLPFLDPLNLVHPLNATIGLLVFAVALVVLELKRIELADYVPSLVFAPALAYVARW